MNLYHYTCDHGHQGIRPTGIVLTGAYGYAWFTDLPFPRKAALGLTSHVIACDRTAHRYRAIKPELLTPWAEINDPTLKAVLEGPGTQPEHWFVSRELVRVALDERGRK